MLPSRVARACLFSLAASMVTLLTAAGGLAAGAEHPRGVVLVTVDSLRGDHLPYHGYPRETAPFLAGLAARPGALLFDNAHAAAASCGPAHLAILTGRYPHRIGVPFGGEDLVAPAIDLEEAAVARELDGFQERFRRASPPLARKKVASLRQALEIPEGTETLATLLRRRGFRTGGFVSAWTLAGDLGYSRGFERFDEAGQRYVGPPELAPLLADALRVHTRRGAADTAAAAREFLATIPAREPFFLFLHLADTHYPYRAPAERRFRRTAQDGNPTQEWAAAERVWAARYDGKDYQRASRRMERPDGFTLLDDYDESIRATDGILRDLVGDLESRGLLRETLLVITADHGESFGEHPPLPGDPREGPFFGHGAYLWQETQRVPLLILDPRREGPAERREEIVSHVDLAPTVLAAVGAGPGEGAGLPGRDLREPGGEARPAYFVAFGGEPPGLERDLLFAVPRYLGFRDGDLKFVLDQGRFADEKDGKARLHLLGLDPAERHDLSGSETYGPHVQRYRKELLAWYQDGSPPDGESP